MTYANPASALVRRALEAEVGDQLSQPSSSGSLSPVRTS